MVFRTRGQTLLEYLMLLGLVAFVAFIAMRPKGVLDQTVQTSNQYFKTGSRAILGGYYDDSGKVVMESPSAIDGGWCAWSKPVNGFRSRECACPRPAFGGKQCDGPAVDGSGEGAGQPCDASKNLRYVPGEGCVCWAGEPWDDALQKCVPAPVEPCDSSKNMYYINEIGKCGCWASMPWDEVAQKCMPLSPQTCDSSKNMYYIKEIGKCGCWASMPWNEAAQKCLPL